MPNGFKVKVKWEGDKVAKAVDGAGMKAVSKASENLLEAANRTVPHDEGILQDSGKATPFPSQLAAVVSYDTPYARRQHEDTRLRHPNGRRAKWLELTTKEQEGRIREYVANEIRAAL